MCGVTIREHSTNERDHLLGRSAVYLVRASLNDIVYVGHIKVTVADIAREMTINAGIMWRPIKWFYSLRSSGS